jgi:hypothetical protein
MKKNHRQFALLVLAGLLLAAYSVAPAISASAASSPLMQLTAENSLPFGRSGVPITWSVPLAVSDQVFDTTGLVLSRDGLEVPSQFTAMARWGGAPDDPSKPLAWVLVDTFLDLPASGKVALNLLRAQPSLAQSPLKIVNDNKEAVHVETGAAVYSISKEAFRFFDTVTLADGTTYSGTGGLLFRDQFVADPVTLKVEHQGVNRISLWLHGTLAEGLEYTARLHFYAHLAEVKVDFRLENLNPPQMDQWGQPIANDYGSPGSVSFKDLSVVIPGTEVNSYLIPTGNPGGQGEQSGTYQTRVSLVQDSSGDARWDALTDFEPKLQSGVKSRSSKIMVDQRTVNGPYQMAGWFAANGVTAAVERGWQNFPKTFRAQYNRVEIGLFPGEFAVPHELRAGEFKTHTFWIRHHGNDSGDIAARARSFLAPVRLLPSTERIAQTLAAGLLAPRLDATFPDYEKGTDYQITPSPQWREEYEAVTILDAISRTQSYGWVDYGDIPTDFENPLSPYNLKYNAIHGMIIHALRNGDSETWWELAGAGARHAADIDIQHARVRGRDAPRNWFDGGMYGHGYHDEDGRFNPHRNYQNPVSYLSGPAAGLFAWGLLAGDTLILDSARELADNMFWRTVNSDYYTGFYDQVGPAFRECAVAAGLQRCEESACTGYEPVGGSRTGGNIVQAMLMAYLATGDATYRDLVSQLAHTIHCYEQETGGPNCDRFHFQTTFVRNLGWYLHLLKTMGLPEDAVARDLLARRMDYMTRTLWDAGRSEFRMCYDSPALYPFHDNWLLSVADAFAVGSLVLGRPDLLDNYALKTFQDGSRNQFYEGSALSYHSTKEFVNQAGFGNMFLYAWQKAHSQETKHPDLTGSWSSIRRTGTRTVFTVGGRLTVRNSGSLKAPSSVARIYLSRDGTLDSGDLLLGSTTISALAPGKSLSRSLSYRLRVDPRKQILLAVVDPDNRIAETSETNNLVISPTIR